MATVTIRLDGAGDYTSATAAFAAGGVNPGDRVSFTEAGTYANESWTGLSKPPANVTVANDSGGVVAIQDVALRVTYMIDATAGGMHIIGCQVQIRSNYQIAIDARLASFSMTGSPMMVLDTPAVVRFWFFVRATTLTLTRCDATVGTYYRLLSAVAGANVITVDTCDHRTIGVTTGVYFSASAGDVITLRRSMNNYEITALGSCAVAAENCWWSARIVRFSTGSTGSTGVFDGCGNRNTFAFVSVSTGVTVASLTIRDSYAPGVMVLLDGTGAITAFAGANNRYASTAASTTSASDKTCTPSLELAGPGGLVPREGGALHRQIAPGTSASTATLDMLGNPRDRGGWRDVGPVQNQRLPRPAWRKLA